jgi:Fur family zinc uptake transcriptional regulator
MTSSQSSNKKLIDHILTKNQKIVFNLLQNSGEPLKAYTILESLKREGLKSPLQIYRALDKLVELGIIHKIESQNSFIACSNSNCASNTAFTICRRCGDVKEIKNNHLFDEISKLGKKNRLNVNRFNLEFYIDCNGCKVN